MSSSVWQWSHKERTAAGLIVQTSALPKIEKLQSLIPLIEAANSSGVRLLDGNTVEELMSIVSHEIDDSSNGKKYLSQSTLSKSKSEPPIGRILAPVGSTTPPPLPISRHSSGFSREDFPLEAKEIDSDISIHFDITGNSSTEGKITDMQSCFRSRLSQIREMMLSNGALPRRPISNSEAWKNRRRYNSRDFEITIVGLASEVNWTSNG